MGSYATTVAPWIGELIVGQMFTFPRDPKSIVITPQFRGQERSATRGGTLWVWSANYHPVREVRMVLETTSPTTLEAVENELLRYSRGGQYKFVLLPQTLDATEAIYGRVSESMSFSHSGYPVGHATTEMVIMEEPLPRL